MDDNKVSFEEENFGQPNYVGEQDRGNWMVRSLLKIRWVETQTQAFYVIFAAVILVIIFSVFIFSSSQSSGREDVKLSPEEIFELRKMGEDI